MLQVEITSLGQLENHLLEFIPASKIRGIMIDIDKEFNESIEWRPKTMSHQSREIYERKSNGVYSGIINRMQARITVKGGKVTAEVAYRVQGGCGVLPGWFGRLRNRLRRNDIHLPETQLNRFFTLVNSYTKNLNS